MYIYSYISGIRVCIVSISTLRRRIFNGGEIKELTTYLVITGIFQIWNHYSPKHYVRNKLLQKL